MSYISILHFNTIKNFEEPEGCARQISWAMLKDETFSSKNLAPRGENDYKQIIFLSESVIVCS